MNGLAVIIGLVCLSGGCLQPKMYSPQSCFIVLDAREEELSSSGKGEGGRIMSDVDW